MTTEKQSEDCERSGFQFWQSHGKYLNSVWQKIRFLCWILFKETLKYFLTRLDSYFMQDTSHMA
jgi:hypothetical protein